jgi:hypothetical protein
LTQEHRMSNASPTIDPIVIVATLPCIGGGGATAMAVGRVG